LQSLKAVPLWQIFSMLFYAACIMILGSKLNILSVYLNLDQGIIKKGLI